MDMTGSISSQTLERLATFGELLRYLRRRAGLTQTDLSIAVGCSDAQISRLEQNLRLPNVANVDARFLPALKLKHEPVARERLLWLAIDAHRRWADAAAAPDPGSIANTPSIAVMPFLNLSTDPGNEYFCDGLAEELLNALTKIRRLFVVARASAFSFKGKDLDAREIGRRLNVDTILEGSVKREDDRLRVAVHLINTDSGFQIWSERFDRRMTDLFALQDEITLAIVDQLKVELLEKERLALLGRHPVNLEAFNLYLKGRFYWARRPQGINKAIEYFELAIEKDPRSAVARAGLADCYVTLGSWENGTMPPVQAMAKAKSAASIALELDGRLAEAHATLAYRTTHHDWDWATAEAQFRRALELNPNYAVSHHWYSHYLTAMGRTKESLEASKRCLELDPLDLVINVHMAWHHQFARQYEEAVDQCWKTNELHPNSFWPPYFFALAYQQQGKIAEAEAEFQKAIQVSGNVTFTTAGLGHLYASTGKFAEAQAIFRELCSRSQTTYVPAYDLALVCVGFGWTDQAFDWLSKAFEERSGWLAYLNVEPRLDTLRRDSRFDDLLRGLRLMPGLSQK
jgi:TolB-like protein/Tfp pilus assembly protein PilF/DNA-binding XRE family transcriptional regulator